MIRSPREAVTGLVFLGQHDRQNPNGFRWVALIQTTPILALVPIVELPENLVPLDGKRTKIVLPVGVIFGCERFKSPYPREHFKA